MAGDNVQEIKRLLKEIVGANPNLPIKATVLSVQSETVKVILEGGLELTDVKLSATIDESDNYYKLTPKVGSQVLLISLSGDLDNLCVIKVDEVEKFEFKQNGLELLLDSADKKVKIANNNTSLKELFDDLKQLLTQFKVYTPAGPSGTPLPPTITALEQLEIKVDQLLK